MSVGRNVQSGSGIVRAEVSPPRRASYPHPTSIYLLRTLVVCNEMNYKTLTNGIAAEFL
jgi:hypothetical protein